MTNHCGADDGSTVCALPVQHNGQHQSAGGRLFMLAAELLTPELIELGERRVAEYVRRRDLGEQP